MHRETLPLIVEPEQLQACLVDDQYLIIDLSKAGVYYQQHIPGAIHIDFPRLTSSRPPVMGLLPEANSLSELFTAVGLQPEHHVVAYDEEGGGKASRLLWTLDVIGHQRFSLLNGGLQAWAKEGHPVSGTMDKRPSYHYEVAIDRTKYVDREYILEHLRDPAVRFLDVRSPGEYAGTDVRARRGGHIPGAVNVEWTRAIDQQNNLRLRPRNELEALYRDAGIDPDKEIITYCHTHHRSAHSYIVLKSLDYPRVKGYPGSWSEWGNEADTPIDQ
jgi:thiosulfate/3-mercaptopyruvate sulfurtransferase